MNVLVVSAHPDDETLGCGGTLLRHRAAGHAVYWMVATRADAVRYGAETARHKAAEVEAVAKAYGMAAVHQLDHLPARLDEIPRGTLIEQVSAILDKTAPEVIYSVSPGDVHSDHRILFEAVEAAIKPFRAGRSVRRMMVYEVHSSTDLSLPGRKPFTPTSFVEITTTLEEKVRVLGLYASEVQPVPHARNGETCRALARVRGAAVHVPYAEAFEVLREVARAGEPL